MSDMQEDSIVSAAVRGPHCPACSSDLWLPDQMRNPVSCAGCGRRIDDDSVIHEAMQVGLIPNPPYHPSRLDAFVIAIYGHCVDKGLSNAEIAAEAISLIKAIDEMREAMQ